MSLPAVWVLARALRARSRPPTANVGTPEPLNSTSGAGDRGPFAYSYARPATARTPLGFTLFFPRIH
jgi:hypothetical protein